MKRQLIAATAALSLALPGMSSPALAKDKDLLKLLLGAAAVGLVLNELNGGQLFRSGRAPATYDHETDVPFRRKADNLIPGECAMALTVNGRVREVVSDRCVREFGLDRKLPAECAFDIRTSAGTRRVYGPQCLSDYGYKVASINY